MKNKKARAVAHFQLAFKYERGGAYDLAEAGYKEAIKSDPTYVVAHYNLGNVLRHLGKLEESAASYRRAIKLKPNDAFAHNNLGNALRDLGRLDEASASYRRALKLKPDYAYAYNNLGNVLRDSGRFDDSETCYRKAIEIDPSYALAHSNLGGLLRDKGQLQEAEGYFRHAVEIDPACPDAHIGVGLIYVDQANFPQAEACFRKAVEVDQFHALAHSNLGRTLAEQGKLELAAASHRSALALNPRSAVTHSNFADTLQDQGKLDEAISHYEQAMSLMTCNWPNYWHVVSQCVNAANRACRWKGADEHRKNFRAACKDTKFRGATFPLLSISDDPALHLDAVRNYQKNKKHSFGPALWRHAYGSHEKIRIAYLSADFREHATAYLMAELFERHDRTQFEFFAISFGPDDESPMRQRLVNAFDHFVDVQPLSDFDAAKAIRDLEIDIAVDLKGYTRGCREDILAYRPAPIQVNYLGYPGTMGADFIDYIVVDPFIVQTNDQHHFTERCVWLPDSYQVNDTKRTAAPTAPTRQEAGLPESGFVFCCFNHTHKYRPEIFDVWMRLLNAVPGSVLWLLRSGDIAEGNLRNEAEARDVEPGRLIFAPWVPQADHLARYRLADLFLDTLPYNAHTTASDALWMGLPVLTCAGRSFQARVAGSLLRAAGLPELITHSLSDYEALALHLATEPSVLNAFRIRLMDNRLKFHLFDIDRFRRHLEAAYRQMMDVWKSGQGPSSFAVPAEQTST